jgi:glycine/D-amino acid oxidase-like deaminating enzyme
MIAATSAAIALDGVKGGVMAKPEGYDVAVVGAGVFGAWTAERLRAAGQKVLLIDAWGPAHARASSGGESRLTRTAYGADDVYTRMAWDSLGAWKQLSALVGLPVFHEAGVLFFFQSEHPYATATMAAHKAMKLPTQLLDRAAMTRKFPQIDFSDIALGLYEPKLGILMARRAVQTLVDRFVRDGGTYLQAQIKPPAEGASLDAITTLRGETIRAKRFVFACGPWLPKLFPGLVGGKIFPTRQEIFFFAPPPGDTRFGIGSQPGWADFNGGDLYYGCPDLEARGFKIAFDKHGPPIDPNQGDRIASAEGLANVRAYMARRFPAMAGAALVESRVCQYENSANGDLLIDRHPDWENSVIVGAGSGHGFKHGPEVGRYAAQLLLGTLPKVEPRFSLASKGNVQDRSVH